MKKASEHATSIKQKSDVDFLKSMGWVGRDYQSDSGCQKKHNSSFEHSSASTHYSNYSKGKKGNGPPNRKPPQKNLVFVKKHQGGQQQ